MSDRIVAPLCLVAALAAGPLATAAQVPTRSQTAADAIPSNRLETMLREIAAPSGIGFKIAPGLERDPIPARLSGTAWPEVVANLLRGYNYVGTWDGKGRLSGVSVTGRKGDGAAPSPAAAPPEGGELLTYRREPARLPPHLRKLKPGSVHAVAIPLDPLRRMTKGTRVAVNLPDGRYEFLHDNAWSHGNGDTTWVGYVEGAAGGPYRALLTLGEDGVEGWIRTPGGRYQLESEGSQGWLVDLAAAGLQPVGMAGDEHLPASAQSLPAGARLAAEQSAASVGNPSGTAAAAKATFNAAGQPMIDLTVLYTSGLANKKLRTRLNQLVALANQALADSQVNAVLRLAAARQTSYPNGGSNDTALDNLTDFQRDFRNLPRLRRTTGADMVLLIRPFLPLTQGGSCGEAWVNGSDGTQLSPDLAFGVVGYGAFADYYCTPYTLAHEAGHILGATHDRDHANGPGAFEFSYGYGVPGLFGDIMSYIDPEIGLYANPNLVCAGQPCGVPPGLPNSADVALTFNKTAGTVSSFRNAVMR